MKCSSKAYNNIYVADFETLSGDVDETWVWAWASCNINDIEKCNIGNSIDSFIDYLCMLPGNNNFVYFHNLSHDGSFILDWLFNKEAEYCEKFNESNRLQFNCLIGDDGSFFNISVKLKKRKVVTFRDSSKKVSGKVADIARDWKTKYQKLELDYLEYHEPGENLSDEIKEYVCNDVRVIAEVLKHLYDMGYTNQTIASDSQTIYRKMYPFYYKDTPSLNLEEDGFVRKSYKGGWCYLNPKYQNIKVDKGVIYDINSSYPSVMASAKNYYPVGRGIYYTGKYDKGDAYVYIAHVRADIELKENKYPCISKKRPYSQTEEYIEYTEGMEEFWLTQIDLELLKECYDIIDIDYIDGYYYNKKRGSMIFGDFINELYEGKCNSTGAKKQTYKITMNSSYGKYGQKPVFIKKVPYMGEDGIIKFRKEKCENEKSKGYIPLASFITAYARKKVIDAANANYDRFIYSDTDSIHLLGWETPNGIEIDKTYLGKWDDEYYFIKGRYAKLKTYMLVSDDKCKITAAGMSDDCKEEIKNHKEEYFDKFKPGLVIENLNLKRQRIKGGVTLIPTAFTIKMDSDIMEM